MKMLEVQELKKSFGGRQILDGVDLTVKDGEILCIVGPSGAGKNNAFALHYWFRGSRQR
jgi:polar amino acid transport system ATP-binding protein